MGPALITLVRSSRFMEAAAASTVAVSGPRGKSFVRTACLVAMSSALLPNSINSSRNPGIDSLIFAMTH